MSVDDRAFVERLLEAGRRDAAEDTREREAKIVAGVLAMDPRGGGNGSSGGRLPLWGWVAASCVALLAVGTGIVALSRPRPNTRADVVEVSSSRAIVQPQRSTASNTVPNASAAEMDAIPTSGTSVWALPSVPAVTTPSKKAMPTPNDDGDDLARQLAAIASARRKLRDQDPVGAASQLDDFDQRFARPRVGDEATVLRVEVLLALGRADDARALGRAFVGKHPDSIYRARLAQLLGENLQ